MAKKSYIGIEGAARKVKNMYIGVENFYAIVLPNGYTQVEYIESTGAQYIDTGIIGKSDLDIYMDLEYTSIGSTAQIVIGCLTASSKRMYPFSTAGYCGYGTQAYSSGTVSANTAYTMYAKLHAGDQVVAMNEYPIYRAEVSSACNTNLNMFLCAANNDGTAKYYAKVKLRSCQIRLDGTFVRDYIPCVNPDGVVGLYDKISGTFSASASSTAFVAGSGHTGVARKIKKAYIGVDGIARLIYGGVTWNKYSCTTSYFYQKEDPSAGLNSPHLYGVETSEFYSSYSWSETRGFILSGKVTLPVSSAAGYYKGHQAQVYKIVSVSPSTELGIKYIAQVQCVGLATQYTSFSKGTTSYGEIVVEEGSLPEEGTLIRGSIDGNYCVLRVNNTYYYYEKVT